MKFIQLHLELSESIGCISICEERIKILNNYFVEFIYLVSQRNSSSIFNTFSIRNDTYENRIMLLTIHLNRSSVLR